MEKDQKTFLMTDIHAHLLYGFDDGASDCDTCCRMLELYAAGGVKRVVCTSHSQSASGSKYDECFARAGELAQDFGITLIPALEYSLPDVLAGQDRPLGNGQYLLLDPGMTPVEPSLFTRLMPLNATGNKFLWAHPERLYPDRVIRTVDQFAILAGSACQLNSGSFTGNFGTGAKDAAWELLTNGRCAVIGSDAHSPEEVADFIKLRQMLAQFYPDEFIRLWFETNPERILSGKTPERRMPPPLTFIQKLKLALFH